MPHSVRPFFLCDNTLIVASLAIVLRHATSPPHSDGDTVELSERVRLVGQGLQEFGREAVGPNRLAVRQRTDRSSSNPCLDEPSPSGPHFGYALSSPTMVDEGRRLGVKQLKKPPHSPNTSGLRHCPAAVTDLPRPRCTRVKRPIFPSTSPSP